MRDYGRVHTTFWSSATTSRMSDSGKLLALYLMTCTHNTIAGVFRLPDGYVADDLGWPLERVQQGFAELLANGFVNRCETTKWVWVVKHLKWNPLENPNQRKAAMKVAAQVPDECAWKAEFLRQCELVLGPPAPPLPGVAKNPSETVPEPFLNQEQEQEQEQKQEQKRRARRAPVTRPDDIDPQVWSDFVQLRDRKNAPITETVIKEARREATKAGIALQRFLEVWCARGSQGLQADWLKPSELRSSGTSSLLNADQQVVAGVTP